MVTRAEPDKRHQQDAQSASLSPRATNSTSDLRGRLEACLGRVAHQDRRRLWCPAVMRAYAVDRRLSGPFTWGRLRSDDVVVTSGALQAADLVARATLSRATCCLRRARLPISATGIEARGETIVPIDVDWDGLRVDALPAGPNAPLLVYATAVASVSAGRSPLDRAPFGGSTGPSGPIARGGRRLRQRISLRCAAATGAGGARPSGQRGLHRNVLEVLSPRCAPATWSRHHAFASGSRLKRLSDYHTPWPVQRRSPFLDSGIWSDTFGGLADTTPRSGESWPSFRRSDVWPGCVGWRQVYTYSWSSIPPSLSSASLRARQSRVFVERIDEHYLGPCRADGSSLAMVDSPMEQVAHVRRSRHDDAGRSRCRERLNDTVETISLDDVVPG